MTDEESDRPWYARLIAYALLAPVVAALCWLHTHGFAEQVEVGVGVFAAGCAVLATEILVSGCISWRREYTAWLDEHDSD